MTATQSTFGRRAKSVAFALAATASFAIGASPSHAADISKQDCGVIAEISSTVVRNIGPAKLSTDFRRSMMEFVMPDRKTVTCSGPRDIMTSTGADIDAFNTIRTFLLAGTRPISLEKVGLRSVDPATVASAAPPAPSKRSELQGQPSL